MTRPKDVVCVALIISRTFSVLCSVRIVDLPTPLLCVTLRVSLNNRTQFRTTLKNSALKNTNSGNYFRNSTRQAKVLYLYFLL